MVSCCVWKWGWQCCLSLCYPERIQRALKNDFVPWKTQLWDQVFALGSSSAVLLAVRCSRVCSFRQTLTEVEQAAQPVMLRRWAAAAGEGDMGRDSGLRSHPFLHVEAEHDPLLQFCLWNGCCVWMPFFSMWYRDPAGGCLSSDRWCTWCVNILTVPSRALALSDPGTADPWACRPLPHLMLGNPGTDVLLILGLSRHKLGPGHCPMRSLLLLTQQYWL